MKQPQVKSQSTEKWMVLVKKQLESTSLFALDREILYLVKDQLVLRA
jgi:hypothetical protein